MRTRAASRGRTGCSAAAGAGSHRHRDRRGRIGVECPSLGRFVFGARREALCVAQRGRRGSDRPGCDGCAASPAPPCGSRPRRRAARGADRDSHTRRPVPLDCACCAVDDGALGHRRAPAARPGCLPSVADRDRGVARRDRALGNRYHDPRAFVARQVVDTRHRLLDRRCRRRGSARQARGRPSRHRRGCRDSVAPHACVAARRC